MARLVYTDEGRGEAVVFLHAFPLDGRMWAAQARELSPSRRVIVPDFAGFGGSTNVAPRTSLDEHADDVAALLDALEIERATIAGLSMGGYVALAFARRHAKRIAGLVLADTKATPDTPEGRAARDQNIALVRNEGVAPLVERLLSKLLSPSSPAEVVAFVRGTGISQTPEAVVAALAAMRDRPDSTPLLASLDVPAAVIVGEDDAITPPADARAMTAALPRAELVVLPRAGHLANLEAPQAFNAALGRVFAPAR